MPLEPLFLAAVLAFLPVVPFLPEAADEARRELLLGVA